MSDKLTVYLHIGSGKVGSSSIHYWLLRSEKDLNARGILLLDQDMNPHIPVDQNWIWNQNKTFRELPPDSANRNEIFAAKMDAVSQYMRDHGFHSVIISSVRLNAFANNGRFHELFVPLVDTYDWRVIYYVRNQKAYLESAWKQWYFSDSRYANVDDWLSQSIGKEGNWWDALQPWAQVFLRERITVRMLDRQFMRNGSLWDDFAYILNVPNTQTDERIQNESFNNETVSAMSIMVRQDGADKGGEGGNWYIKSMLENRAQQLGFGKTTDTKMIGSEWDKRIYDAYAQSNQRLVEEYFDDNRVLESLNAQTATTSFRMDISSVIQYALQLLMQLVFSIDQENRSFRQRIGHIYHQNMALQASQKRLEEKINTLMQKQKQ